MFSFLFVCLFSNLPGLSLWNLFTTMQAADVSAQLFDGEYDDIPGFQGSLTFLHSLVSVNDLSTVSSQVLQALVQAFVLCQSPVWVGKDMHSLASA